MASFIREVLKGVQVAIGEEKDGLERLRKSAKLAGLLASEMAAAAALTPFGLRAIRVKRLLPKAFTDDAARPSSLGVVLFPDIRYGPAPRQQLDVYVPQPLYQQATQQRTRRADGLDGGWGGSGPRDPPTPPTAVAAAGQPQHLAPVVFFCHGGVWATGDRWQFGPLAARLSQAGCVVVVVGYSLFPDALAARMACEVLQALLWTLGNIARFSGDARQVTVLGHSAGAHLAALAVLLLAQQRHGEELERRQASAPRGVQPHGQPRPTPAQSTDAEAPPPWLLQAPAAALDVPRPLRFIGMSGVYDVPKHHEYEASRGVHHLSTMSRACGGPAQLADVSPSRILQRAADTWQTQQRGQRAHSSGTSSTNSSTTSSSSSSSSSLQPGNYYDSFHLAGEAIPARAGLAVGSSWPAAPETSDSATTTTTTSSSSSSSSSSRGGPPFRWPSAGLEADSSQHTGAGAARRDWHRMDAGGALRGFSCGAAQHLPPFILMGSCRDHMVPFHEAAELAAVLQQSGLRVPVKLLVYNHVAHNEFVFDWPLRSSREQSAAALNEALAESAASTRPPPGPETGGALQQEAAAQRAAAGDAAARITELAAEIAASGLPAFAKDIIDIVTNRVAVQYAGSRM